MADFLASVNENIDKLLETTNKNIETKAVSLFKMVVNLSPSPINLSPWAKGELVNQWYVSLTSEPSSEVGNNTSPYGAESMARIASVNNSKIFLGKDGTVSLSNNLSYAYKAEYAGWNRTSPYAMIRKALFSHGAAV
jgi:hypothetical protein